MSNAAHEKETDVNARYKRAIRTAEELFKKVGFRGVTMELIAREANVAKATLYSYFKNKDELFLAVCARMARILREAVEQALMRPGASLDARLADAVIAKHRPIFALVRVSAHAAELFSYTHSMAGEIFADLDVAILEMLGAAMADAVYPMLLRIGVDSECVSELVDPLFLYSNQTLLRSYNAGRLRNFRTEMRIFRSQRTNPRLGYRLYKYLVVGAAAMLLPPRRFYQLRDWVGRQGFRRFREWAGRTKTKVKSGEKHTTHV